MNKETRFVTYLMYPSGVMWVCGKCDYANTTSAHLYLKKDYPYKKICCKCCRKYYIFSEIKGYKELLFEYKISLWENRNKFIYKLGRVCYNVFKVLKRIKRKVKNGK